MSISISDKIDWTMPAGNISGGKSNSDWTMPAGEYGCEIVNTEMKSFQEGKLVYMDMKFKVVVPSTSKDRLFFIKFYFQHADYPNLVAKNKKQLKEIGLACFGLTPERASEFIGGKLYLTLSRKEGNPKPEGGTYPASNRIEAVRSLNGSINANTSQPSMSTVIPDPVPVTEFNDEIPF